MKLNDTMILRTWQYTSRDLRTGGVSKRHTINENLTGAALGDQEAAYISFRTAMLIVMGWNYLMKGSTMRFYLVIPLLEH